MRILVFTHRTNFSGGANRSLLAVLIGLKGKGHEIKVVLPRKNGALNNALDKVGIEWIYVRYYRMGAKAHTGIKALISKLILKGKYAHHYMASVQSVKKLKNEKFDVVYMNTILPYIALFTAKRLRIPVVIHDRESLDTSRVSQIPDFEKFLSDNSKKIIAISRDLKEQWFARGFEDNIVMINNGIPFQECEISKQEKDNGFHLLLTARISYMKHHDDALNALVELRKRGYSDIHLHFAGSYGEKSDSEYKEYLDKIISKNSLGEVVTFHGEVSDMNQLRQQMNVELMCNPNEPFGRVTVEGMRSGLVVIGINSGGTLDIIRDGENGILYNNVEELTNKIELIYKDDNLR